MSPLELQEWVDASPDGFAVLACTRTTQGTVGWDFSLVYANRAARTWLPPSQPPLELLEHRCPGTRSRMEEAWSAGTPRQLTLRRNPDGSAGHWRCCAARQGDCLTLTLVDLRELDEHEDTAAVFTSLLRSAPFGIALFDAQLRFVAINPRLARWNHQPPEAHLGRTAAEMLQPSATTSQVLDCLRRVLATGTPIENEELRCDDPRTPGSRPTFQLTLHPLRRAGAITGLCACVEDITARRQAEAQRDEWLARERAARGQAEAIAQALGESEARYRAILAALDEGIVVQGRDGSILTANSSAESILGLSVDQLAGRTSMDARWRAIHEDGSDFPGSEHPAMVALRTGEPVKNMPMGIHRPDSALVWLSVNAQPLRRRGEQEPYMVVSSFFDVTEFKRALQAIYLSEQRFRSLVEATTQMVWTTDAQGRAVEDSPSWRAFTGQSREEYGQGEAWQDYIHPEDRERCLARWRDALTRQMPLQMEQRIRRYDGEYRLFLVRMVPVLAPDGSVREWIGTHTDISAMRQAESERARLLREAQEAVRTRDEFLTVAAHELRTPLTSLRLQLQLLLRQLARASPEFADRFATRAQVLERQIGRLASLVYTLLDVSRLATGQLSLEPREMNLGLVVQQLAEAFAEEFQRVGSVLTVEGAQEPLVGIWDPLRVEQVVVNLLSNAVRYGAGKPVELRLSGEGNMAVLVVKDQGIGISEDSLARIFGKFERAVSERHYGGLGLGLYITRQIIDAMGGTITVESQEGVGTTFTVRLPRVPSTGRKAEAGEAREG